MSNVVSNLFISNLKKCLFHHKLGIHAKLPGRIILPYPVFGLRKQFLTWHNIWAIWWKEHNHRSCSGWVPCFVCFPAFRGHMTLFFACLLIRFSERLQLGHSLEVTTKIDRFQRIDGCIVCNIVFVYCHVSRL